MNDLFASPSRKAIRPHQQKALDMLRQSIGRGNRKVVLQLPTGAGKTYVASQIALGALSKGKRVCFTVPRISLIDQTIAAFEAEGINGIGVIQSTHHRSDLSQPVQIASMQTMTRRGVPEVDVVIVDECHEQFALLPKWMELDAKTVFVGLSATPWTRGMGDIWQDLVRPVTMQELIDAGYLSPFRVYAPSHPDLGGVATVAGDYHEGQLAEVMGQSPLIADVVDTWVKRAEGRPTLIFAVNLAHAEKIQEAFAERGIKFGYCHAKIDLAERQFLFQQMARGELAGIVNVGTLTTGVDADVRCVVLARPTKSEPLFVQMIGRGLRTADGKDHCIARDSLVLTDKGLVKIQDVTLDHKVWDGVSFVNHGGAVCRGVQPVITYDGVTGTTDHEVMTEHGWKTLAHAHRNGSRIARTGMGGQAVWFSEDSFRSGFGFVLQFARSRGVLELWRAAYGAFPQYAEKTANECVSALQWAQACCRSQVALCALSGAARSLLQSALGLVSALWRKGDRVPVFRRERGFALGRAEFGHRGSFNAFGQDKQRGPLRAGKSSLGAFGGECEQHPKDGRKFAGALRWLSEKLSGSALCRPNVASLYPNGADGCRNQTKVAGPVAQAQREVWDIYNAGPLQRFTVNGRLVHNCLILDHSDNHARLGFVTSINHDTLLTGKDKAPKPREKEKPEQVPRECPSCGAVKPRGVCPACGFEPKRQSEIEFEEGELVEITGKPKGPTMQDKQKFWSMALAVDHMRHKDGRLAKALYKSKFGVWPRGLHDHPIQPDGEFFSYERSRRIAFAKRRERA